MSEEREGRLVPVRTFSGNMARLDAEVARGFLTDAGIDCFIVGEISAAMAPFLDVPLLVRAEDVARASEILEDAFALDDDQSDADEDPGKG